MILLAAVTVGALAAGPGLAASGTTGSAALGVYKAPAHPPAVDAFGAWLGRQPKYALDFLAFDDWTEISEPIWWLERWQGSPYTMVFSVGIVPDDGVATLAQGAAGQYDAYWSTLAQNLVSYGQGSAVVRLAWEFNGNWFPWSASLDPGSFVTYWRRIVDTMRSVAGADFRFDWSPVAGVSAIDPETVYPGDAYVDYIGMSVFDQSWYAGWQDPVQRWTHVKTFPFGLEWQRGFAGEHGKLLSYPEWSLIERPDGHGGGDDPYFIERMHKWLRENRDAIAYHIYFDPDPKSLTENYYPNSAVRFRELFVDDFPATGPVVKIVNPRRKRVTTDAFAVLIKARVSSPNGVRRVAFRINGRKVCIDRSAPFTCRAQTRKLNPGRWNRLTAAAIDGAGRKTIVGQGLRLTRPD
ncbi:MAG: Ig-like domain-containing protein [Gaiellales bacterium]